MRRINNDLDEFGNLSEITLQSAESKLNLILEILI